jgi:hypothetical protein
MMSVQSGMAWVQLQLGNTLFDGESTAQVFSFEPALERFGESQSEGHPRAGLGVTVGVEPVQRVFCGREGDAATRIKLALHLALSGLPLSGPEVGL